jgi:hypothetical protein
MSTQVRYAGPILSDTGQGLHGGTALLTLSGPVFVLQLARHYAYGIESIDTLRGGCQALQGGSQVLGDGYLLHVGHWHRRQTETTTTESDHPIATSWRARSVAAPGPPDAVLGLRFALGTEGFDLLLRREPAPGETSDPALVAWHDAACAQRQADADEERARRDEAQRHAQAGTASTTAFASRDYAQVVALLAPLEAMLTPAERQRLALARRRLEDSQ